MNIRKKGFVISCVGVVLFGVVLAMGHVKALTEEEMAEYSLNDIMFYQKCKTKGGGSGNECGITVTGSTIEEKIWSGLTSFLTEEQAAGAMGSIVNESGFSPVKHEYGFPEQYPDLDLTTHDDISYGIGLMQWSYGRRTGLAKFLKEKVLDLWTKYIDEGRKEYGKLSGSDFLTKVGDADTDTLIGLELCYMKQESETNPRYANFLNASSVEDASDYFVAEVESPANIPGQQAARRPKAQAYYDQFHGKTISGGVSSGNDEDPSCNACKEGSLNINGTAVCLAWPLGTEKSVSAWPNGKPTPLFEEAYEELFPGRAKGSKCQDKGASCDVFTSTVVRWSGYDKKFPRWAGTRATQQVGYARKHPELWEVISWDGDKSKLQAGDVINTYAPNKGHSFVVVQDENGVFYAAQASYCDFYGRIDDNFYLLSESYIIRATSAKNNSVGVSVTDGVKTSSITGKISGGEGFNNGDINASAFELAWPEDTPKQIYYNQAYDRFVEVFNQLPPESEKSDGQDWKDGQSCMVFVNTVLQYAGAGKAMLEDDRINDGHKKLSSVTNSLVKSDEWEEVGGEGNDGKGLKYKDLQPGDVLSYFSSGKANDDSTYYKGYGLMHEAIYAENPDGKGRKVEAGWTGHPDTSYWGHVTNKDLDPNEELAAGWPEMVRVFRWKGQAGGCNVCDGDDDSGGGQLKEGGYDNVEDAQFIIDEYHKTWKNDKPHFGDVCDEGRFSGSPHANCTNFSMWFAYHYMGCTDLANKGKMGYEVADRIYEVCKKKFNKIKKSSHPTVYSIASWGGGPFSNHTAVVIGINKAKNKIIFADAAWCDSDGRIWDGDLSKYDGVGTYVDISDYVTGLKK